MEVGCSSGYFLYPPFSLTKKINQRQKDTMSEEERQSRVSQDIQTGAGNPLMQGLTNMELFFWVNTCSIPSVFAAWFSHRNRNSTPEHLEAVVMILYTMSHAPNPRRVIVFAAEKNIELEHVNVDLRNREQKSTAFLRRNPSGKIPINDPPHRPQVSMSVLKIRLSRWAQVIPGKAGQALAA